MGSLPGSIVKKGWAIVLALGAGLGLAAEDAFADRSRHNSSSAHQHRHSHQPRHHHVQPQPHRHHHHRHFSTHPRIVVVPTFVPHYFVPAPVYVAPPIIAAPPVSPSVNSGYWYFCPDSRTYYPYVQECASGWLAVVPGAGGPPN